MRLRSWTAAVVAAATLTGPGSVAAAESRPVNVFSDTASTGIGYRLDLVRVSERVRGRVVRDSCLRLTFRGTRRKLVHTRLRCKARGGFEYRSPSLIVADDRDPDKAPLVFGFAVTGLGNVQVPLAGDGPAINAQLRAVPRRFGSDYVFFARGLDTAPLGVRAFDREGAALDGVVFPAR